MTSSGKDCWTWLDAQVDVSEEEEEFQGVVTACLNVLLLGIETRLDGGLHAMVRVNWSAVEAVRELTLSLAGNARRPLLISFPPYEDP